MTTRAMDPSSSGVLQDFSAALGGVIAASISTIDWARTALGPRDSWPQVLQRALQVALASAHPVLILWGPELRLLYNHACLPLLGSVGHPPALGERADLIGLRGWPQIEPLLDQCRNGQTAWAEDVRLDALRDGRREECCFTFCLTPLMLEDGRVGGVCCVGNETTERALEQRRREQAQLEADRARTEFLARASHELRAPLSLVLGSVEESLQDPEHPLPAAQRQRLTGARTNALRLLKLVSSLLDFSRIESARTDISYEPTDLASVTAEIASGFRSLVERAGLRLRIEYAPLSEPAFVDRQMWEKIVLNLLSNAFKFTFEGEIEVRIAQSGEAAELTVRDTGIGIEERHLPRIFDRFYRVECARGRTYHGTGIGLALVSELTRLHGGSVAIESTVGQGTTLTVSIPLGSAHLPADRIQAASAPPPNAISAAVFAQEASGWIDVVPYVSGQPLTARSDAHLLVADDNADMRSYLCRLLRPLGTVDAVSDGVAAMEAVRRYVPDLILADVMMPREDGFALLRQIRTDPATRGVPVLLLSARAGEEARVAGLEAGADDYLVKPIGARELLARVEAQLRLARLRREAFQREQELRAETENVLESMTDSFVAFDAEWRITRVNAAAERNLGQPRESLVGKNCWESLPWLVGTEAERQLRRAMADRTSTNLEYYHPIVEAWSDMEAFPLKQGGIAIYGRDITERKRLETERAQHLAAIEEANEAKDLFFNTLSHELRTPLAAMLNALELLRHPEVVRSQRTRAFGILERNIRHQARLIEDLLDLSRIMRGKVVIEREMLDLRELLVAQADAVEGAAHKARLDLGVSLSPEPVRVIGDAVRLGQVISNLLTNSVKFSQPGGAVSARLSVEAGQAVLRVSDTGIGIPAEALPHIFEAFRQAETSLARSKGGLGIGLAVARSLAELHGGTLVASSAGPGQGSEFTLRLPAAERTEESLDGQPFQTDMFQPRKRVLVVEDNADLRETLVTLLALMGHQVIPAPDGETALKLARSERPQVALVDIGLPGIDGYEVARNLGDDPSTKDIRLLALTGYATPEHRERALRAGFEQHLAKPLDADVLERVLREM